MPFSKLVRFHDGTGKNFYGDLLRSTEEGFVVQKLIGNIQKGFEKTKDEEYLVSKLTVPKYPVIFTKPADSLAGPSHDISIHPDAQPMLDYEGELTVVVGRDGKNIQEEDALSYVLGYTCGNDVSARNFQLPDVSGGQFCYAKSFDGFAPIGPAIYSAALVGDPQKLRYTTSVNGEVRQSTGTDDMIWSVKQLIVHLSRGTTLRAGTLIMTGTPSGVGFFGKPQSFLKDGDTVEVEIEGLGKLTNTVHFEKV